MNGAKVFFDTCAVIKLLEKQYDLTIISIDELIERQAIALRRNTQLNLSWPGLRNAEHSLTCPLFALIPVL